MARRLGATAKDHAAVDLLRLGGHGDDGDDVAVLGGLLGRGRFDRRGGFGGGGVLGRADTREVHQPVPLEDQQIEKAGDQHGGEDRQKSHSVVFPGPGLAWGPRRKSVVGPVGAYRQPQVN